MGERTGIDRELLSECRELIDSVLVESGGLRSLLPEPGLVERLARATHTVKGLVGFLLDPEADAQATHLNDLLKTIAASDEPPAGATVDRLIARATLLGDRLDELGGLKAEDSLSPIAKSFMDDDSLGGARAERKIEAEAAKPKAEPSFAPKPAPSWSALAASAAKPQIEALGKAVPEALDSYGLGPVTLTGEATHETAITRRDLTVVTDLRSDPDAALIFEFDSATARSFGLALAEAIIGAPGAASPEEERELIDGALGELVNAAANRSLALLGRTGEVVAPRFIREARLRIIDKPVAFRAFNVETRFGSFMVGYAPDVSLCIDAALVVETEWKRHAILADDSLVMRKTVEKALVAAGFEVVASVPNGMELVEEFRQKRPDLVVTDLSMPVMGGLDALKLIRAEDPSARVLICSAIAESGMILRGMNAGAVGYVTKPFIQSEMVGTIERLFEKTPVAVPTSDMHVPSLGIYKLGALLGEGGMARVYEGFDPGLARRVAIKVIRDAMSSDPDFVVQFLDEARTVARLNHQNVVSIFFAGSDKGKHFFVMELLAGPDLEHLVQTDGPLDPAVALGYLRQAALGLRAAAAEGLIHCDVKPANLIFGSDGLLKVTDFGIARKQGGAARGDVDLGVVGTPCFMSPEQVLERPVDHRADIYALGATLYFMLTGSPPYEGDDPVDVALRQVHDPLPPLPRASRRMSRLHARMMAKSPDARHRDYDELLDEIERV